MNACGVYLVRNADEVIYVGSSGNIPRRISDHKRLTPWWSENLTVETIPLESRAFAYHRERELIRELTPKHNRMSRAVAKSRSRATGPVVLPRPEALARLIDQRGSVAALASEAGVDHMTLSEVWRGAHHPSSKLVAALLLMSGLSFDELFYVDPGTEPPTVARRQSRSKA